MNGYILIYLKGAISIIILIGYIVIYNIICEKLGSEKTDNIFQYVFMPILFPIAIISILFIPYIIGLEFY